MQGYQDFTREIAADPGLAPVQTTLYDLIEAVSEAVLPEEEQLVAEVVSHLINTSSLDTWVSEGDLAINPY